MRRLRKLACGWRDKNDALKTSAATLSAWPPRISAGMGEREVSAALAPNDRHRYRRETRNNAP
ncbi:hypothetical protein BVI1335_870006 [Burkholderia vietnamiensis]|nr:hypothetical protein BVI1335_870006 [Burkholderia vietnamiensis]